MQLHLRQRQERHVDGYDIADRKHASRDRENILHLIVPEALHHDILRVLRVILARCGDERHVVRRSHLLREHAWSVNVRFQPP